MAHPPFCLDNDILIMDRSLLYTKHHWVGLAHHFTFMLNGLISLTICKLSSKLAFLVKGYRSVKNICRFNLNCRKVSINVINIQKSNQNTRVLHILEAAHYVAGYICHSQPTTFIRLDRRDVNYSNKFKSISLSSYTKPIQKCFVYLFHLFRCYLLK